MFLQLPLQDTFTLERAGWRPGSITSEKPQPFKFANRNVHLSQDSDVFDLQESLVSATHCLSSSSLEELLQI